MALVVLALVIYGAYGEHRRRVSVNGATATLWDWLHLLLLPLLVPAVILPVPRTVLAERFTDSGDGG